MAYQKKKKPHYYRSIKNILSWSLGEKTIVWLSGLNKYIITENNVARLIGQLVEGTDLEVAIQFCIDHFKVERDKALAYVNEVQGFINECLSTDIETQLNLNSPRVKSLPFSKKYYSIFGKLFLVEYDCERTEQLIHPKFEFLKSESNEKPDHHFKVVDIEGGTLLLVNDKPIGAWGYNDSHYLGGKFSMQILQCIYQNEENDWMGVFHAAGITDGEKCLMFLGDSGNGKSTLTAILMANGFGVLADDFLPVESSTQLVCHFPSAISVKKNAYDLLIPLYPQLKNSKELHHIALGKTFRYLPVLNSKPSRVPCVALVFVKYQQGSGLLIEEMTHEDAFQQLVPDSWVSPTPNNAQHFVEWFKSLPCYRLTYSDNAKMVETINQLFNYGLS